MGEKVLISLDQLNTIMTALEIVKYNYSNFDKVYEELSVIWKKKRGNRIYVAGTWEYKERVIEWMDKLKKAGYEIIVDWTNHTEDDIEAYADEDFKGVLNCDLLLIDAKGRSSGKMVELGIGLTLKKRIYIIGQLTTVFRGKIPKENFFNSFNEFFFYLEKEKDE